MEKYSHGFQIGLKEAVMSFWGFIDQGERMAKFIPTKTKVTTQNHVYSYKNGLLVHWWTTACYGLPMDIISEKDSNFSTKLWTRVFKNLETTLRMSSSNHPLTDGRTERVNKIIEDILWAYVAKQLGEREQHRPMLELCYNSCVD